MVNEAAATPTTRGQFPSRTAEATPLTRRTRVVTLLVGAACVLSPWMVGAWEVWSQWVTLGLALAAFLALFLPMFDYRLWPASPPARASWSRLRQFPIFWIGLALLVYGAIAALNPSRQLVVDGGHYWFNSLAHLPWLPHGVDAPFWQMNSWRALVVLAPSWLVVCAIWASLDSEEPLKLLLTAIGINGAALAVFGIAQRLDGTREMFWLYDPRPEYAEPVFFASFIYSGHAAAWLVLAFGAAVAVLDERLQRRDPLAPNRKWGKPAATDLWWLAGLAAMLVAIGEFVKPEFWALAPAGILAIWAGLWIQRLWRAGKKRQAALYSLPMLVLVIVTLSAAILGAREWKRGGSRYPDIEINPRDPVLPVRYAIARTSAEMIGDAPVWGWGPGSYRYIAPDYLKQNALFTYPQWPGVLRFRANHAHSDWVELVAEWGMAGGLLFVAALGWWIGMIWERRRQIPGEIWCVVGATVFLILGALADFPLYNPSVLVVLGTLAAISLKLGIIPSRRPAEPVLPL